jgi:hypothetical protein
MFARVLLPFALLLALVGTATAEKAKLAVLGFEVAGSVDRDSTGHGRLLSDRFRARVAISQKFVLAPNSMKDLLEEKVSAGCDNEAPDCMAKIGASLKASFLMFGKIEKRPKDGKDGYQLSMKLLDVEKKTVKEWGDWIPFVDFVDMNALDNRAAAGFDTLTRSDGDPIISGPGPGPGPGPVTPKPKDSGGFPWKPTAVVTSSVALAAFGGFVYYAVKLKKLGDRCTLKMGKDPDKDKFEVDAYEVGIDGQGCVDDGKKFDSRNKIAGYTAAAVGGIALFAIYKGFIAKKESPTQTTTGRSTRKKKQFAVTPIVSPEGGGATFRLDW